MNLELLQAFTLTDDHETQEQISNELQPWDRSPQSVRRLLSKDDIPARDKRVRFVGLSKYEAEGGLVKRDLFHDGEQGVYILDPAKLTRLVNEKLENLAEEVKADGWKRVEVQPEFRSPGPRKAEARLRARVSLVCRRRSGTREAPRRP